MATNPLFSLVSIIFLAGATVLLFFIILGGTKNLSPLNQFYWLEVDTHTIPGARETTRWTLYNTCGVSATKRNIDCGKNEAAYPFDPLTNFNTSQNIPHDFIENESTYYYLTRFAYPFFLIGLFFTFIPLALSALSCLSRLGAALNSVMTFIAFMLVACASSLITSNYVMAKDEFNRNGHPATLGAKLFAFQWTAVFLLLASFILLSCAYCVSPRPKAARASMATMSENPVAGPSSAAPTKGFFSIRSKKAKNSQFFSENDSTTPAVRPQSSFERLPRAT